MLFVVVIIIIILLLLYLFNILLIISSIVNIIIGLIENNINMETFNMDKPYPMGLITELNILNKNNI